MVVIHDQPIKAEGSYDLPLQPVRPFWMLEYVSKSDSRKDYDDNMRKYEHEMQVPYYMLFVPDEQELTLYHHREGRYISVQPDESGRYAIPELELAVGLLDGWVRYWFRGELLPLPADLLRSLEDTQEKLAAMTRHAQAETLRADKEKEARLALERELETLRAQVRGSRL
jgi:hypothetical protein